MADDPRLSCGRAIDDVWDRINRPPDAHERGCPYCQEARERLLRLSDATADLRVHEETDPARQPSPTLLTTVMSVVRAEVRRGQSIPLDEHVLGLTISEQAVVGLVWTATDAIRGIRARQCRVRAVDTGSTLIDIAITLAVDPGTPIPQASEQLRDRIRTKVNGETGLRIRRIDLAVEDVL